MLPQNHAAQLIRGTLEVSSIMAAVLPTAQRADQELDGRTDTTFLIGLRVRVFSRVGA